MNGLFGNVAWRFRTPKVNTVNGCEPGISIELGAGAPSGDYTVGAGGGYGGFYCFALGALAP